MIGDQLGKYKILEEVGQGGMSVVYRAHDTVLDRNVAIKVLHPHLSRREESKKRFEREARAVAKLAHNRILQVFDFSATDSDTSYIVMEFLSGCTLREFIEQNPITHPEIAAMLTVHLCSALSHAHSLGIIHRDIKPENIMIAEKCTNEGTNGGLKLMDFGIAEIVDAQTMTTTGTLLGSPAHMSPEMIEGHDLDFRADIFSLGTVLYFAATGELPFSGRNAPLVLKAILEGDYINAEMITPRVGRRLSRIIDRCLSRDPDDRYSSAASLQRDLESFLNECNLVEIDREIEAFFADPESYQTQLGPKLVDALEQRGLDALKTNQITKALDYFGRVLTIEPDHPRVLDHIRNIDRRRRLKVYVGGALLVATFAGLTLGLSTMFEEEPENLPAETSSVVRTAALEELNARKDDAEQRATDMGMFIAERAIVLRTDFIAQRTEQTKAVRDNLAVAYTKAEAKAKTEAFKIAKSKAREEQSEPKRILASSAAGSEVGTTPKIEVIPEKPMFPDPLTLKVTVHPPTAKVKINGQSYTTSALKRGIKVQPGPVTWEASCDICQTKKGQKWILRDSHRPVAIKNVKLSLKPAIFRVNCLDDKGATVLVFDKKKGQQLSQGVVGRPLSIAIIDQLYGSRAISWKVVSTRGAKPKSGTLTLNSGQMREIAVQFK